MNNLKPVVVYGPKACGKTKNAERLRARYGCSRVVDGWDGAARLKNGDLALTINEPPYSQNVRAIAFSHTS